MILLEKTGVDAVTGGAHMASGAGLKGREGGVGHGIAGLGINQQRVHGHGRRAQRSN